MIHIQQSGLGGLSFEEGQFSVFGYVLNFSCDHWYGIFLEKKKMIWLHKADSNYVQVYNRWERYPSSDKNRGCHSICKASGRPRSPHIAGWELTCCLLSPGVSFILWLCCSFLNLINLVFSAGCVVSFGFFVLFWFSASCTV